MRRTRIFLAAALFGLGGCATPGMNEAECRTADWRAVGFEDGARGTDASAFGAHRRACAEHGVSPGFDAYLAGHAEGLERFCRPENGARLGASGHRYGGVCPAHLEDAFVEAYAASFALYEHEQRIAQIDRLLTAKRQRVRAIEVLLVEQTAHLVAPHVPPAERASTLVSLKQLREEQTALQAAIHQLEHERVDAVRDYERHRAQLAAHDPAR